ncbi:aldo/keto reductase [Demequina mangrovi]|uniref:Predicted oxidoreductase n=1 Tax=Demequina mangrovi TaxID=1043493 RepID=A0A1H6W8C2_9MICO|nr:aldo/keto reductase [Demequina mangrovi]SEJ08535.1 Predicted oxidoreductase [Demequina mangrovi]
MASADEIRPARRLGAAGPYVAPLGVGAMLMGTRTPEDESRRILDHFVTEVVPRYAAPDGAAVPGMIDTADAYCWWYAEGTLGGQSERLVGTWLADSGARPSVHLATKGTAMLSSIDGVFTDGEPDWELARSRFVGAGASTLRDSLAASLGRLGLDSVDLYYIHVDDRSVPLEETLGFLASAVSAGLIRTYGWSNVSTWRLAQIRALCEANGWPQPAAVQQQHAYLRPRAGLDSRSIVSAEQLDYLRAYPDLQLVAYSPVLKGLFSAHERRDPGFSAMGAYAGPDAEARLAAIDSVAAQTGATGNQVALAWLLAQDSPSAIPLIGARTFDQYLECAEAIDVTLTPGQHEELEAAGA